MNDQAAVPGRFVFDFVIHIGGAIGSLATARAIALYQPGTSMEKILLELLGEIAHPRLLGLLLAANILIFIQFARTVYRDPDDMAEDVKDVAVDLAAGHSVMNRNNYIRVLGAIFFILVCASVVKAEYLLITWIIS